MILTEEQLLLGSIALEKCPALQATRNSSITVFLRLYQRHYLEKQLAMVVRQSVLPEQVVILQNRNLTQFAYDSLAATYAFKTRVFYIWNVNWNAFFHLSYLVSAVMPTPLSFTFDDDQLLSDPETNARAVQALIARPAIYSLRAWCWCKQYLSKDKVPQCGEQCKKAADLAVNPFFTFSAMAGSCGATTSRCTSAARKCPTCCPRRSSAACGGTRCPSSTPPSSTTSRAA